jgi:hypothetical protein
VACSPNTRERQSGYATPAALVTSLALSILAVGFVQRSVMTLRLARADLDRLRVEYALDGAQLQAAAEVVRAGAGGPFRWALATDAGWTEALVEDEGRKLALASAAQLPDAILRGFEVEDAAALKARLAAAAGLPVADVAGLDAAPLWRECAPSMISSFGRAERYEPAPFTEPHVSTRPAAWRVGETWRVRVTTAAGWRDDRIMRFTGDARHPAATVWRRLSRSDGGQGRCDAVLAAAG